MSRRSAVILTVFGRAALYPVDEWVRHGQYRPMEIDFFYDIVCPYAYLGSSQIEAIAERHGATINWHPVLLGGIFRSIGGQQVPMNAMSAPRARLNALDLQRFADLWGVPFSFADGHPRRSVEAMRLLTGLAGRERIRMTHRLFRAYWVDGENIADRHVLDRIAGELGVSPEIIDSNSAREGLFSTTSKAVEHGAFGVPAFVIDGQLWWGQDRLNFVEDTLGEWSVPSRIHSGPKPAKIRFFHDFSSPFSYLAATQIQRVAIQYDVEIQWRPILLGALFREIGTPDVPLFEMSAAKRDYVGRDLKDWARWWQEDFSFPSQFPIRTVAALRLALAEPSLTDALYRAAWSEDRAIDDPAVLREIVDAAGLDPEAVLARIQTDEIKTALRENTALAKNVGACGVPTFQLLYDDPARADMLIWGQDRIHMLEHALCGWHPACG